MAALAPLAAQTSLKRCGGVKTKEGVNVKMQREIPSGVFATGCIVGLVLTYTNFVGFLAGVITGIVIQTSGPSLGNDVVSFALRMVSRVSSTIKPPPTESVARPLPSATD